MSRRGSSERPERGEQAPKTGARVISYEFGMFRSSLRLWEAGQEESSSPFLLNVAIETTLLHARNLLDFFSLGGFKDDVKARDFMSPQPRIALSYLRRNRKRVNKKLAHPSYSRSRMNSSWDRRQIESELDGAMRAFLERLQDEAPDRRKYFSIP